VTNSVKAYVIIYRIGIPESLKKGIPTAALHDPHNAIWLYYPIQGRLIPSYFLNNFLLA
jgi:hypothetical protein